MGHCIHGALHPWNRVRVRWATGASEIRCELMPVESIDTHGLARFGFREDQGGPPSAVSPSERETISLPRRERLGS